jgi:hypothetical protein
LKRDCHGSPFFIGKSAKSGLKVLKNGVKVAVWLARLGFVVWKGNINFQFGRLDFEWSGYEKTKKV